jgi:transcriptional regulator with XRE-family HTH domain
LTVSEYLFILTHMTEQQPTSARPDFIQRLEQAIRNSGLTKAEVAFKADISPAYLSRLLHGVRGEPADTIISRLEDVLDIQPRGQLFHAAGRLDTVVSRVLKKPNGPDLMRKLAPLTDDDMNTLLNVADALGRKAQSA